MLSMNFVHEFSSAMLFLWEFLAVDEFLRFLRIFEIVPQTLCWMRGHLTWNH